MRFYVYIYDLSLEVRNIVYCIAFFAENCLFFYLLLTFLEEKRICDFDVYKLIYKKSNSRILIMTMNQEFIGDRY